MAYPKHAEEAAREQGTVTTEQLKEVLKEYLLSQLHGVLPWTESLTHERFEEITPIPKEEMEEMEEFVPFLPIKLPPYIRRK